MPTRAHACKVERSSLGAAGGCLRLDIVGFGGIDELIEDEKEKDDTDGGKLLLVLSHRIDGSALSVLLVGLSNLSVVPEDEVEGVVDGAVAFKEGA